MLEFELRTHVPASPEAAWAAYTDHAGWRDWAGFQEVVLRQRGDPAPNGLGAIRVLRRAGLAIEEEVVRFDPPRRFAYRLVAGLPVRDYRGEVTFAPDGEGTALAWRVEFRPAVPGTGRLLRSLLRRGLADVLGRFARLPL